MDDDWGTPISGNHRIEVTNFGVKPLGDSNWNSFRCFCFGQGFRMITFPNRMRLGVWPSLVLSTPVLTHTLPQVTSKHGGEKIKHEDWICLKIRWFSGLSWFIMAYHGLSHGLSWFILVYHGLSWFILVYHGLSWFIMVYHNFPNEHGNLKWFPMSRCTKCWLLFFTILWNLGEGASENKPESSTV